ncbi:uncharacterized protein LOC128734631 [Sabethes cyaneus]|uniref:uncharacterized protein LOC128734631 n=1 Tax=Sabethes cyaneus TaxID=53552 RepID=UPI00237E578C|nr:uncharacterized protein LOC128734631 [Sabethes cyaneus]
MADDEQQPGPSTAPASASPPEPKDSEQLTDGEPKDCEQPTDGEPKDSEQPTDEEPKDSEHSTDGEPKDSEQPTDGEQPKQSTGRKRKLSAKRHKANKRGSSEDEVEARKLRHMVEPILQTLRRLDTADEHETMRALIHTLQPSQDEIDRAVSRVKTDLVRVLRFPDNGFQIYEFGSVKSGLAFRDSDLDFYIHYEITKESKQDQNKIIHVVFSRMLRDVNFDCMVKILGAKVPLLRAIHVPTNLTCDINFSNARGCYNSKFIYAVTRFDYRIHQMAVIIKFWSKCAYLLTNHRQMNTYCIVMMLIFYLQTKKLPLLPSVQDLQMGNPRMNYGAWNLGYPREINFVSLNKETVRMLLVNFFKYYANFDFGKKLISPYVGRLCSVEEMRKSKVRELQPYYRAVEHQDYPPFNFGTMLSIQDPFELNLNIGGVCNSAAHFEQFKLSFQKAYEVCCENQETSFSKLLAKLFTDVTRYHKVAKPRPETLPNLKHQPQIPQWRICRLLPIEYELFIVREILRTELTDKTMVIADQQIKDMWADCMIDFIEDILEKIYLCQVMRLTGEEPAASVPPSINRKDIRTLQLRCERQVMFKRPRFQFSTEEELNNEIAISKARWELNRPMTFTAQVDMFKTQDAIEFHINGDPKDSSTQQFVENYFLPHVRKCINGYFKLMLTKTAEKVKQMRAAASTAGVTKEVASKPAETKEVASKPDETKEVASKPDETKEVTSKTDATKEVAAQ